MLCLFNLRHLTTSCQQTTTHDRHRHLQYHQGHNADTLRPYQQTGTHPPPFRLFALLPELRAMVYKELLTIEPNANDPKRFSRHSQVLRVSKEIYEDAKPTLQRLNKVRITVAACTIPQARTPDHTMFYTKMQFPGDDGAGAEDSFWRVFAGLPLSDGTCHDVRSRWQHALRHGGYADDKLSVELELSYYSSNLPYAQLEQRIRVAHVLEREGTPQSSVRNFMLAVFEHTTSASIPARDMSMAEVFQLAFALEHLAPTPADQPFSYVSANTNSYHYGMRHNHAREFMAMHFVPRPARIDSRGMWMVVTDWMALPGSVVARWLTKRARATRRPPTCMREFRLDLKAAENELARLKVCFFRQRSPLLVYKGPLPLVVSRVLPAVEKFLREEHARHARGWR